MKIGDKVKSLDGKVTGTIEDHDNLAGWHDYTVRLFKVNGFWYDERTLTPIVEPVREWWCGQSGGRCFDWTAEDVNLRRCGECRYVNSRHSYAARIWGVEGLSPGTCDWELLGPCPEIGKRERCLGCPRFTPDTPDKPAPLFVCEKAGECKPRDCFGHDKPHEERTTCDTPCRGMNGAIAGARCIPVTPRLEYIGAEWRKAEIRWSSGLDQPVEIRWNEDTPCK
jgi:hypothetical protein